MNDKSTDAPHPDEALAAKEPHRASFIAVRTAVVFGIAFVLLAWSYLVNPLRSHRLPAFLQNRPTVANWTYRTPYDRNEWTVLDTVYLTLTQDEQPFGGFMARTQRDPRVISNDPKVIPEGPDYRVSMETHTIVPYLSNTGFQAKILIGVADLLGWDGDQAIRNGFSLFALITALTTALTIASIYIHLGTGPAVGALALMFSSTYMIHGSGMIWWALGLRMLPFALAFALYPWSKLSKRNRLVFVILLTLSMAAVFLTGYEFVSAVAMIPIAVTLYFERHRMSELKHMIREVAISSASVVLGLTLAVSLHVLQLRAHFGTMADGLEHIQSRGQHWSERDSDRIAQTLTVKLQTESLSVLVDGLAKAFGVNATVIYDFIAVPVAGMAALALGLSALAILLSWRFPEGDEDRQLFGLSLMVITTFVGGISWLFLLGEHARIHPTYSGILWTPLLLSLGMLAGRIVERRQVILRSVSLQR